MSDSATIASRETRPTAPEELHTWIQHHFEASIPRQAIMPGHAAPFDYLIHTFFEGEHRPQGDTDAAFTPDCIVWANRGGGKTFLGALATALDLLFKPGIQIRLLAGSVEQGSRMHQHLRTFLERGEFKKEIKGRITDRRIALKNGAVAELLAQSQASVRGTRPQKLRCDEVELFDDEVWSAAQLTTRSTRCDGRLVRGAIECLSTMHRPHGLMSRLVAEAAEGKRRLFKWGVLDIMEACPHCPRPSEKVPSASNSLKEVGGGSEPLTYEGNLCPFLSDCHGDPLCASRTGHLSISDALRAKSRVSLPVWDSEMLCNRPSRTDSVFPEFSRDLHVTAALPSDLSPPVPCHGLPSSAARVPSDTPALILAGKDFGYRAPTVFLWASLDASGTLTIFDERHAAGHTMDSHIRAILESDNPRPSWIGADPAGNSRNEHTGASSIHLLKQAGLSVHSRRSTLVEGISLIRARLKPADGSPPRLFIHARCTHLIQSLEQYHYDPERPYSDEPVKDGSDHAVDALRYLVVNLDRPFTAGARGYLG